MEKRQSVLRCATSSVIVLLALAAYGCSGGETPSQEKQLIGSLSQAVSTPGSITVETWTGVPGTATADIPLGTSPSALGELSLFEVPTDAADNYGVRVRGWLHPPVSGNYSFWVAGDDNSDLYLSTDASEANKVRIAYHTSWTNSREWNKFSTQRSTTINLVSGQQYYIEALMKEGFGGDNLAVGWLKPGESGAQPSEVIPGAQLSPIEFAGSITFDQWFNISGTAVTDIPTSTTPDSSAELTLFEIPINARDNYGVRVRGYVVPPTSGNYTFWIAGDDNSELYLSSAADESGKALIAYHNSWTNSREWNKFSTQQSSAINLVAGQQYYIEALMKEGFGGDNLAVGWLKPGESGSQPSEVIPGAQLRPYEPGLECPFEFGDCDGDPENGCETELLFNDDNCGACGNACGASHVCEDGFCLDLCSSDQLECDGDPNTICETDTASDANNCGGCGNVCTSGVCTQGECETTSQTTLVLQAEDATWSQAVVEAEHAGYTGTGYVNTNNVIGSYVEWTINVPSSVQASVEIFYALGSSARLTELSVNGNVVDSNYDFLGTGAWTNYASQFTNISLNPGANTFRVTGVTSASTPNLDKIEVTYESTTGTDSDLDGLTDDVETNTGIFNGPSDTGTDPNNADTDADGINDGDEVLGTDQGLDLPAMGLNPLRKNILLEYDWFDDANECGAHSHQPTPAAIDRVNQAFANSPVSNPDGSTGITLINDYGQGGVFSGGNFIDDPDGVLPGGFDTEFQGYKSANFAANRQGYFHYVIMPHRYNTNSGSSGLAELFGDDMIVSLYCSNSDINVANTIMHELGHNLGLFHGGANSTNYKPNYNSVMNYLYQFPGVDVDCDRFGDGVLDFSYGERITLDENALDESAGVCGDVAIDWNSNSSIDTELVSVDVNQSGGTLSVLQDSNDWANLFYDFDSSTGAGAMMTPRVIACDNPAPTP